MFRCSLCSSIKLQELAVLAASDSNTNADLKAIDAEAEALGDDFIG